MRRSSWLVAPIAVGSLAAGIAVAGTQSSETTPVRADFEASLVKQEERTCDSSHSEFRLKFEGSQTSSDPRLTGDLEAKVRSVVNIQTGWGRTFGKVTVREPGSGRPKFHGQVVGVLEPDGGTEGFLGGQTVARPHVALLANFNVQQNPQTGAITGEFGKDSQTGPSQDPAILTNACLDKHHGDDKHADDDEHADDDKHDGGQDGNGRHDREDDD
jgi:hypothetical protein